MYYKEELVDEYLKALKKEINKYYKKEVLKTIYIGGGTPSDLNLKQLRKLFKVTKSLNKARRIEFTFECNIDIEEKKLKLLKKYGVNRLSIGIQTINNKYLKVLNRNHNKDDIIETIKLIKKYFFNINVDLMYGFDNQTIKQLDKDIDFVLALDTNHISIYSLIIEPHTILYINKYKNVNEDMESKMYYHIIERLQDFRHYEISNFAKEEYKSRHNLIYWNNKNYYGFGLGASGYIDNIRYDNTKNINEYLKNNYRLNEEELDLEKIVENEFILGLRKIKGINKYDFKAKYNINITDIKIIQKLLKEGNLIDNGINIKIPHEYLYISNSILVRIIGELDEVRCF